MGTSPLDISRCRGTSPGWWGSAVPGRDLPHLETRTIKLPITPNPPLSSFFVCLGLTFGYIVCPFVLNLPTTLLDLYTEYRIPFQAAQEKPLLQSLDATLSVRCQPCT